MAKFGVSYNLFDGEELLEDSILSIRDSVNYISVVYQTISNHKQKRNDLKDFLKNLRTKGLIDEFKIYNPILKDPPYKNEIAKRNIGMTMSRMRGMKYHMSMDTDEFYTKDQLEFVKNQMVENMYEATFCQMRTYYKDSCYQIDPPEKYYVPMFYSIRGMYIHGVKCPVVVDPTRTIAFSRNRIFKRDEVEMHHMSYVRKDIRLKLENSSARVNFKNIDAVVECYNNWTEDKPVLFPNTALGGVKLIKVEPIFTLENYHKW